MDGYFLNSANPEPHFEFWISTHIGSLSITITGDKSDNNKDGKQAGVAELCTYSNMQKVTIGCGNKE